MKNKSTKIIIILSIVILIISLTAGMAYILSTKRKTVNKKFEITNTRNVICNINTLSEGQQAYGSDIITDFQSLFIDKISNIPVELLNLVTDEQMQAYLSDYDANIVQKGYIPTSASEGVNVISFINYFDIKKETFIDSIKALNETELLPDEYKYSDEDIAMLFSNNEASINQYFASDYCIVCEGYVYSPEWLLKHTSEEIKNAGITTEMIQKKMTQYNELPLTNEDKDKFQELLNDMTN